MFLHVFPGYSPSLREIKAGTAAEILLVGLLPGSHSPSFRHSPDPSDWKVDGLDLRLQESVLGMAPDLET